MEIGKMEKALKVYEKIQSLDAEIIGLEKLAMQLANDETEVSLDFKVLNVTEKDENSKVEFDEDGSIVTPKSHERSIHDIIRMSYLTPFTTGIISDKKDQTKIFSHSISTTNALKILGILLGDKIEKRQKLLNKLSNMGVKI